MAEKHSDVCEDAEIGSECDCPCAGRRHAVKHTKGGAPGAGSVSKRVRAIAEREGRAPVTGNPGRATDSTPAKTPAPVAKAKATPAGKPAGIPAGAKVADFDGLKVAYTGKIDHKYATFVRRQNKDGSWATPANHDESSSARDVASMNRDGWMHAGWSSQADPAKAAAAAKGTNPYFAQYTARPLTADGAPPRGPMPPVVYGKRYTKPAAPDDTQDDKPSSTSTLLDTPAGRAAYVQKMSDVELTEAAGRLADGGPLRTAVDAELTRRGFAVTSSSAREKEPDKPAAKVPAPLRKILDVIENPKAHEDTNAAARYQHLTYDHMALMTPEQKQAMLDDLVSRAANGYKADSPTGKKLTRAHATLVYAGARFKAGMRAGPKFLARPGEEVTHPAHGHGKVKSTTVVDGKSQAVVDFGDKTETVPHTSLTFGHVGADKNTDAKGAAKVRAGAARNTAGQAKLTGFADGLAEHRRKSKDDSLYKLRSDKFEPLAEFNKIAGYPPEVFKSLPAADKAKVLAALDDVWNTVPSADVRKRVAKVLQEWAGQDREVPRDPDPKHVVDAKRALEGGNTTLPRSMVYASVSKQSLETSFTPEQRAKMRADAGRILDNMNANAPDRKGLQRVVDDLDAIDPPKTDRSVAVTSSRRNRDATAETRALPSKAGDSPTRDEQISALRAEARTAQLESMLKGASFAKRDAARQRMHDAEAKIFKLENPWRTAGPAPSTFQGKKVRPVTANQQPVLEAVGANQGVVNLTRRGDRGMGLAQGALSQLERTGHIMTIFSNGAAHLTDKGHVALAVQRGDGRHMALNEKVAAARAELAQAELVRKASAAVPFREKDHHWQRRSFEVQQAEKAAYARLMDAIDERNKYLKAGPPS